MDRDRLLEAGWRYLLATAAAVYTWFAVVSAVGLVGEAVTSLSLASAVLLFIVFLIVWPLGIFFDNEAIVDAVIERCKRVRRELLSVAVLVVATLALDQPALLFDFLELPSRSLTPYIYRLYLFYRPLLGEMVSGLLFDAGMLYVRGVGFYLLSSATVALIDKSMPGR